MTPALVTWDVVLHEMTRAQDPSALRDAVAVAKARAPQTLCLALVPPDEPDLALAAMRAGMDGCVVRGRSTVIPMRTVDDMGAASLTLPSRRPLSAREWSVVQLLARGLGYKEIAASLEIGLDTVRSHVRRLYKKLGVHTAAEAAAWAAKRGALDVSER
jgi:DNA-binding NarL/FixJ family response regulator